MYCSIKSADVSFLIISSMSFLLSTTTGFSKPLGRAFVDGRNKAK
jgi:hypothetical protein